MAKKGAKTKKVRKKTNNILERKTIKAILMLLVISIIIYILYMVIGLIMTPTDTFIIKDGVVSVEESGTRIYNKRRNYSKRYKL